MSEGIPYADLLILALVAGFILLRLRSVLGKDTDGERPDFSLRKPAEKQEPSPVVVQLHDKLARAKPKEEADPYLITLGNDAVSAGVQRIKDKDPLFSATEFMDGAKRAFEMVFDAFVKGDKNTLKMLLSDTLYTDFAGDIDAQEGEENKRETTLVSILSADMTEADITGSIARIGVKFTSEQVTVMRAKTGEIVEGDPSVLHHIEDEWVFERDVTSKSPNWKIIET